MHAVSPPRFSGRRMLGGVVAVALAAGGGIVAADLQADDETPIQTIGRKPAAAAEPVDLTPIALAATDLIDGLAADLPVPEPSPLEARAATPVVRHGMLEIPSIGLNQPFFEGVTLTAIDNGPSHWPGTPMPGQLGNMVVAGHRVTNTRPFFDLDLAQPGDELIFTMDTGERHVYTLDRIEIVDENAL
ncbi:MAG: class E sortase, partial [Acidimicrobiales bacterium]